MKNKRSPIEQFLLIALLGFAAFTLSQQFFGKKDTKETVDARKAPALDAAFLDLNVAADKDATLVEIAKLQEKIKANPKDEYAMWANLRIGLLQQYALHNVSAATEAYDVVINRRKTEAVDAQALYQKGDFIWRQAEQEKTTDETGKSTSLDASEIKALKSEAAKVLEQFSLRSRSDRTFFEKTIIVPDIASFRHDPLQLPARWEEKTLLELRGSLEGEDPRGVLQRVDENYSTTPLYIIFDTVVKWFGAQPGYSYGLALLLLAAVTRTLMQPFIRKQYHSMKGMSLIAPEMKKIQERFKGKSDPDSQKKMMHEIRTLQRAHGVNPMGCGLSMLIQMPVFFFLVLPLINHYQAKMELAGAHFGWVSSLARPDIPLLILYSVSMFISVRLSATPPADDQQKQMQKMTTLMSPLFAVVLWSYPSAFILYWLTYNVLSMFFQWNLMKKSEPDKNLVKTLLGTAQPLSTALTTESTSGALPARPSTEEKKKKKQDKTKKGASENAADDQAEKEEIPFETNTALLNATPGGEGSGQKSGSGSQRSRRRRRR